MSLNITKRNTELNKLSQRERERERERERVLTLPYVINIKMEFYLEHHIFPVIISDQNGDLQNITDMAKTDVFVYLINIGWDQNRLHSYKVDKIICCFRTTTSTEFECV